ncbi:hypothetical protein GF319_06085 [Candidatus Bathyarchaeota archaeon]|nr:hypothetical protein [Candidatus Bathyarchaeota archaeon]
MSILGKVKRFARKLKKIPSNLRKSILRYQQSYRRGIEKFGIWWKIFHWSMWGFVLVFLITATIIFVYYLPLMQSLRYI